MKELSRIEKIISSCNKDTWQKSLGMILLMQDWEQDLLMEEVWGERLDIRFGDNLIQALEKFQELRSTAFLY